MIDIKGLPKNKVLRALVNATAPLRMGMLDPMSMAPMTDEQAQAVIDGGDSGGHSTYPGLNLDYVHGRPIKVDISGDEFCPRLFDRDAPYGEGTAQAAIALLRLEIASEPEPGFEMGQGS